MKKINIFIGNECKGNCKMCFEHRDPEIYNFSEYFLKIKEFANINKPGMVSINENRKSDPLSELRLPLLICWLAEKYYIKKINIITSGNYKIPEELKKIKKIQWGVSIDGPKIIHDENRGCGSYDKAISIIYELLSTGQTIFVRTIVTKTFLKYNLTEIKTFYKEMKKLGVKIFAQRYVSKLHRDMSEFVDIDEIEKLLPKWVYTARNLNNKEIKCIDPLGVFVCPEKPILVKFNNNLENIVKGPCLYCSKMCKYSEKF